MPVIQSSHLTYLLAGICGKFRSSDYSVVTRKSKSDKGMRLRGLFSMRGPVCARSELDTVHRGGQTVGAVRPSFNFIPQSVQTNRATSRRAFHQPTITLFQTQRSKFLSSGSSGASSYLSSPKARPGDRLGALTSELSLVTCRVRRPLRRCAAEVLLMRMGYDDSAIE
jgi:hypothetical protein